MRQFEDTWVVVPLHNEAPVISFVLAELLKVFPHVICVDDGSTDPSARLALEAGAIVVPHPLNLGQGAALQTGFDLAVHRGQATYVLTFDADGQHRVEDAVKMRLKAEEEDLAIVYGSRFLEGPSPVGPVKKLVLRTAALVTRWRTGLHLTDAHNGLRLLRMDAVSAVQLRHNRMAHATEIVEQLARTGLSWAEVPVVVRYTDYTRSKGQSLLNSVNILVELVMK